MLQGLNGVVSFHILTTEVPLATPGSSTQALLQLQASTQLTDQHCGRVLLVTVTVELTE